MNKRLQGRFREVIHNNYILYYFVYMYAQICDENDITILLSNRLLRLIKECTARKSFTF
jgi:hypothetical protein